MSLVLDSSCTLAWIYAEETTSKVREVFNRVAENGAVVPSLWSLEVANSLTMAFRRGRIDAPFRQEALDDLSMLDITLDPSTHTHAWTRIIQLADSFGLTVYDAAYLELAQRRRLPIATLDRALAAAASGCGLQVLGGP